MYFKIEEIPQKVTMSKRAEIKAVLKSFGAKLWPKTAQQERWFVVCLVLAILMMNFGYDWVKIGINQRIITQSKERLSELQQQQNDLDGALVPFQTVLTRDFIQSHWANMLAFDRLLQMWVENQISLQILAISKTEDDVSWRIEGRIRQYQDLIKLEMIAGELGFQSEVIWQNPRTTKRDEKTPNGQDITLWITPIGSPINLHILSNDTFNITAG
ncbi:hypothetical protein DC083_03835 [Ignatzschineria ureiclastica]|uniref:Uncharacterized protein n=1 Tax=Ignatzschineria ureiclastica TaxID=472582 RepID=A0A2U2AFZ7_9GAMM|nr:hypothetical protein [Ignatzschineria ureiclastica]PWD81575.1 hypothetical protein DC083_03835 [Ignatzschineria ureiclastica]GHA01770.1 hypothetical protein GCM10007162_17700 [Ignatzschineria ureiclastica]